MTELQGGTGGLSHKELPQQKHVASSPILAFPTVLHAVPCSDCRQPGPGMSQGRVTEGGRVWRAYAWGTDTQRTGKQHRAKARPKGWTRLHRSCYSENYLSWMMSPSSALTLLHFTQVFFHVLHQYFSRIISQ